MGGKDEELSVAETNKLRLSLGLKPLDIERKDNKEAIDLDQNPIIAEGVTTGSDGEISMSVEATNSLRLKLGLKPLDQRQKSDVGVNNSFNRTELVNHAEIEAQARIKRAKEKRKLKKKIGTKTLADGEEISAAQWIAASKKRKKEVDKIKQKAAQLVEKQKQQRERASYEAHQLVGMKLAHRLSDFQAGQDVVLTLKDTSMVNDDEVEASDELENVYMAESERIKKRAKLSDAIKKDKMAHSGIEDEFSEDHGPKSKSVLSKYDREAEIKNFSAENVFDESGMIKASEEDLEREREKKIRHMTEAQVNPKLDPNYNEINISNKDFQPEVVKTTTSTPKLVKMKKRKHKKRQKPRLNTHTPVSSLGLLQGDEEDDTIEFVKAKLLKSGKQTSSLDVDENLDNYEEELELTLHAARKVALTNNSMDEDQPGTETDGFIFRSGDLTNDVSNGKVFTSASEFSATIESRVAEDLLNNKDSSSSRKDNNESGDELERELVTKDTPVDAREILRPEGTDLQRGGMAAALAAFKSQGAGLNISTENPEALRHLTGQERAERLQNKTFKVDLTYRDEEGRALTTKEAYKHMAHIFHGKKPGKIKIEKLQKRLQQEEKINGARNSDTPLNSAAAMRSAQKKTGSVFVELNRKV